MPASFELRVEITGICLFLRDPARKQMTILMPDTRLRYHPVTKNPVEMRHPDGDLAIPHVGYLRLDPANLRSKPADLPAGDFPDSPPYELVHRFKCEQLELQLPDDGTDITDHRMNLPDFGTFAPVKELVPGLLDAKPGRNLLMRATLSGGTLSSPEDPGDWKISGELHPDGQGVTRRYGGEVHWIREVAGDHLTLKIAPFGGGTPIEIVLEPTVAPNDKPAIALKIANLCANNPLEWSELDLRRIREPDKDFKWFYQLLRLKDSEDPMRYPASLVPHPVPVLSSFEGALTNCFPAIISV